MRVMDKSHYYIDFSNSELLTDDEKNAIEQIQQTYRPVERAIFLNEYLIEGKITNDDFETLTGIPWNSINI